MKKINDDKISIGNFIEEAKVGGPQLRMAYVASSFPSKIKTTLIFPEKDSKFFKKKCNLLGIKYVSFPLTKINRGWLNILKYLILFPFDVLRVSNIFRKNYFDIIHISGGSWQVRGVIAAWLTGKKIIWELNDTYSPKMIRIIFFFLSHLADGFLYASLRTKKYYNKLVPKKNKFFLIQSPVDTNFFDPNLNYNTNKLRKKLNLNNKLVIGTVCNINPVKGLDTYIEAAKAFLTNKDIVFLIIGEKYKSQENYYKYLLSLIKKYNLKNINFIGLAKDVRPYLKLIDVYVCTSKNESSPLSIWEAMSMQKPIVSTDVGDVKKFIINNVNGFVLRVVDKQLLINSIKKLTENQKLRIKFGKNSRKIAKKELNIKKCTELHVNAYKEILRNI